jgi:hypothetical protein
LKNDIFRIDHQVEIGSALALLGRFVTYQIPGYIINGALIFIGISFVLQTGFSPISIISFFLILITIVLIHIRFVHRGTRLLNRDAFLEVNHKTKKTKIQIGYPHSFYLVPIEFPNIDVEELKVRGYPEFGYFIEFTRKSLKKKEEEYKELKKNKKLQPTRFGVWYEVQDAIEAANSIAKELKIKVVEDYKKPDVV